MKKLINWVVIVTFLVTNSEVVLAADALRGRDALAVQAARDRALENDEKRRARNMRRQSLLLSGSPEELVKWTLEAAPSEMSPEKIRSLCQMMREHFSAAEAELYHALPADKQSAASMLFRAGVIPDSVTEEKILEAGRTQLACDMLRKHLGTYLVWIKGIENFQEVFSGENEPVLTERQESDTLTVLVGGGAGFVGSHFADRILEEDGRKAILEEQGKERLRIVVVDDLSSGTLDNLTQAETAAKEAGVEFVFEKVDIAERDQIEQVFADYKPDLVVNFAAQVSVPYSIPHPEEDYRKNVVAFINLIRLAAQYKSAKFIYTSSAAVHGDPLPGEKLNENSAFDPTSPYGLNKASGEVVTMLAQAVFGLDYTIIRPANIIGRRQTLKRGEPNVMPFFMTRAINGEPLIVFPRPDIKDDEDGCLRDYISVSKIVEGFFAASCGEGKNETYNLGSGYGLTPRDLANMINKVRERKGLKPVSVVVTPEPRAGDYAVSIFDSTKCQQELGIEVEGSEEDNLAETQEIIADIYEGYEGVIERERRERLIELCSPSPEAIEAAGGEPAYWEKSQPEIMDLAGKLCGVEEEYDFFPHKREIRPIILAAGNGRRLRESVTRAGGEYADRVLCEVNGKPMIEWVLENVKQFRSNDGRRGKPIIVVNPSNKNMIREAVEEAGYDCDYVLQEEQLGTAHAVLQVKEFLKDYQGDVAVVVADHPHLSPDIIRRMAMIHQATGVTLTETVSWLNKDVFGRGPLMPIIRQERFRFFSYLARGLADAEKPDQGINNISTFLFKAREMFAILEQMESRLRLPRRDRPYGIHNPENPELCQNAGAGELDLSHIVNEFHGDNQELLLVGIADPRETRGVHTLEEARQCEEDLIELRRASLERRLKSRQRKLRQEALIELARMVASGEIEAPEQTQETNNHIHTPFSYSPYYPEEAVWRSYMEGLAITGICDHDTTAGCKDMAKAGEILNNNVGSDNPKIKTVNGTFEIKVNMDGTPFEGEILNWPGVPNINYLVVHGVSNDRLDWFERELLEPMRNAKVARYKEMIARINKRLTTIDGGRDVMCDYDNEIDPLTEQGNATDRHPMVAFARKIMRRFEDMDERRAFVAELLGVNEDKVSLSKLEDENELLGVLRPLILPGGSCYIEAGEEEIPNIFKVIEMCKETGVILTYPYYGEIDPDKVNDWNEWNRIDDIIAFCVEHGIPGFAIMPHRITKDQAEGLWDRASEAGRIIISGVDINKPAAKTWFAKILPTLLSGIGIIGIAAIAAHLGGEAAAGMPDWVQDLTGGGIFAVGAIDKVVQRRTPGNAYTVTTAEEQRQMLRSIKYNFGFGDEFNVDDQEEPVPPVNYEQALDSYNRSIWDTAMGSSSLILGLIFTAALAFAGAEGESATLAQKLSAGAPMLLGVLGWLAVRAGSGGEVSLPVEMNGDEIKESEGAIARLVPLINTIMKEGDLNAGVTINKLSLFYLQNRKTKSRLSQLERDGVRKVIEVLVDVAQRYSVDRLILARNTLMNIARAVNSLGGRTPYAASRKRSEIIMRVFEVLDVKGGDLRAALRVEEPGPDEPARVASLPADRDQPVSLTEFNDRLTTFLRMSVRRGEFDLSYLAAHIENQASRFIFDTRSLDQLSVCPELGLGPLVAKLPPGCQKLSVIPVYIKEDETVRVIFVQLFPARQQIACIDFRIEDGKLVAGLKRRSPKARRRSQPEKPTPARRRRSKATPPPAAEPPVTAVSRRPTADTTEAKPAPTALPELTPTPKPEASPAPTLPAEPESAPAPEPETSAEFTTMCSLIQGCLNVLSGTAGEEDRKATAALGMGVLYKRGLTASLAQVKRELPLAEHEAIAELLAACSQQGLRELEIASKITGSSLVLEIRQPANVAGRHLYTVDISYRNREFQVQVEKHASPKAPGVTAEAIAP